MNISIKTVPHEAQRYDTCGDWYYTQDGDLIIKVSRLGDIRMEFLVAAHELVEAMLCRIVGVTPEQVDQWDMEYEKNRPPGDTSEPGKDPKAPYHKQHEIASMVEGLLVFFMGVDSEEFQRKIDAL